MSIILSFLIILFCTAGWWLARQNLLSKPWLEKGAPAAGPDPATRSRQTARIGLGVFLTVVGALFALFASAYFERMGLPDWRSFPLPGLLWLNTGMLIASSVALHCALLDARNNALRQARRGLVVAGAASLLFLVGQFTVWLQLVGNGVVVTTNPAVTFFYLLTGLHGLHIVGGLIALSRTLASAWNTDNGGKLLLRLELCAAYWHFLLFVWLAIVVVLTGWADKIIITCSQLLS